MITKNWVGRFPSSDVYIGNIVMGGKHPVRLQSMTNTDTLNAKATVDQCLRIIEEGADFVRISTPNVKSAKTLVEIKKQIRGAGYETPLIADIHYNPEVALIAARIVEKIRINPGNYCFGESAGKSKSSNFDNKKELEIIHKNISPLISICKEYGTAIRIGTNHGSLSSRTLYNYGNTSQGMVQATLEYLDILEDIGFYNTIISLKSSNPGIMIEAYRQMAVELMNKNVRYPMHLGVTEAGAHDEGRVRSAIGICSLLNDGIGDTIRVSLSENPENEMPFAKKIVESFKNTKKEKQQFQEKEKFIKLNEIRNKLPHKPFKHPVVITNYCEKAGKNLQDIQKPDFVVCENSENTIKTSYSRIILPYSECKKQENYDFFPLFNNQELTKAKQVISNLKFIIVGINDVSESLIEEICSIKNAILILEASLDTSTDKFIDVVLKITGICNIPLILKCSTSLQDHEQLIIEISRLQGYAILEGIINGLWIDSNNNDANNKTTSLAFSMLQASGKRITTNQYISCPTCARTSFDLQSMLEDVKKHTRHFVGLKIAVMGCVVNGPGEMADADFGLVGSGKGKVNIYKKQQVILKNIEPETAAKELAKLIKNSEDTSNRYKP